MVGDPADTSGLPNCLSETLDSSSSPTVSQLGGTIFGVASVGSSGGGGGTTPPPTTTPPTTPPPTTPPPTTTPTAGKCSASLSRGSVIGAAGTADGRGYWIAGSSGQVVACGDAPNLGDGVSGTAAIAAAPTGNGYWLVTKTGQVKAFGSAVNHGSIPSTTKLDGPIIAMAADPKTGGYWLLGGDGGVFSYDAPFFGSTGSEHLAQPAVGMEVRRRLTPRRKPQHCQRGGRPSGLPPPLCCDPRSAHTSVGGCTTAPESQFDVMML